MEKRYSALRLIGTVYKVLGVIAGAITLLAVLAVCASAVLGGAALDDFGRRQGLPNLVGNAFGGIIVGVAGILYGGIIAVTLYAFGEGVYLLLALEENTRATVALLQQGPSAEPPASS